MESEKRRMLDPRVIRGKKMERGEMEKVKLEKRWLESKEKNILVRQQGRNGFLSVLQSDICQLIGVYFSSHVKCPVWHILADGCTTSQPLSHVPSFNLDKDEDTKKAWRACFFKTHPLIKYAYGSSANYGQLNFHKAKRLGLRARGSLVNLTTTLNK